MRVAIVYESATGHDQGCGGADGRDAVGDTPAVVMEVAVVSSAAVTADAAAEVPAGATSFRGTATNRFMGLESESIVDGVTQYRGVHIGIV